VGRWITGIPTVLLCTEPFRNAARDHAAAFGNPDYQAVRVGHPLASVTPEEARGWPMSRWSTSSRP
jgi:hypothetical protein